MRKLILWGIILLVNFWIVSAYLPLTETQLSTIDSEINSNQHLTYAEKKAKSEYFYWLAEKNLAIRKAFSSISTKITKVNLSEKDNETVNYRINILKVLAKAQRNEILTKLKNIQTMAEELWRLYEIESSPNFVWFWRTLMPTPVYSLIRDEPDINYIMWWEGTTGLHFDKTNLIRELLVVYPQDTALTLIKKITKGKYTYYQVRTPEFDGEKDEKYDYYVDSRFIEVSKEKPKDRIPKLPSREQVLKNMYNALGSAYVRGWTWYQGIPQMTSYFPSSYEMNKKILAQKTLKGVDCSWLLYQATDGYTPRNTWWLLWYWRAVEVEGKSVDEIVKQLKPLDLIVRAGHVVIVYDQNRVIESRWFNNFQWGVMLTNTKERLKEIMETRSPVNNWTASKLASSAKFVVRRWY